MREGPVESELDSIDGPFDTILLYDVLEHLVDPWEVLRQLHGVAAPGARVHVSIPNARHWTLLRDLALRGTFGYTPAEHRDVTHLRWFTRARSRRAARVDRLGRRRRRLRRAAAGLAARGDGSPGI